MGALLAPAGDDQQRVVDRDAETDQRDQELDHERYVGERGQAEDEKECRQDRHRRDQQRHESQERGEDEGQHDEGAKRADQGLDEDAGAAAVTASRRELVVAGDRDVEVVLLGGGMDGAVERGGERVGEAAGLWRVDEKERAAPVVGEELRVTGAAVVDDFDTGKRAELVGDRSDVGPAGGDTRAGRNGEHRDVGRLRRDAVGRGELVGGFESLPGRAARSRRTADPAHVRRPSRPRSGRSARIR